MVQVKAFLLLGLVIAGAAILIALNGCGSTSSTANNPPPPGKINHIVVIFQENRSTDNLFHDPVLIQRGADIASSGKTSIGEIVPLTPVTLVTEYDLGHAHHAFLSAWDNGAMDGAD